MSSCRSAHRTQMDMGEVAGIWVSTDAGDTHRFERLRNLVNDEVVWIELSVDGTKTAQLQQLEVAICTRWLWWASGVFNWLKGMNHGQEQLIFGALSIAGAPDRAINFQCCPLNEVQ